MHSHEQLIDGEGTKYGRSSNNVNSPSTPIYVAGSPHSKDTGCITVPRSIRTTFGIVIVLAVAEAMGMISNMINVADVLIVVGNYIYTVQETAWIGWDHLELWSNCMYM